MKIFNETEIKYLAGLLDADGCLHLKVIENKYICLEMGLAASESIDRHGYIEELSNRMGHLTKTEYTNGWSTSNRWRVSKRSELNQLIPRLVKHMVIKAKCWEKLFDFYTEYKGLQPKEILDSVKGFREAARLDVGPLKAKNHPTWAWTTGYLEGDGYFSFKKKGTGYIIRMGAVSHKNDRVGLDLLHKAFGGSLHEDGDCIRWYRNLGVQSASFAKRFLPKLVNHAHLKKHKLETILSFHNNRLQRLTELNLTG